MLLTLDNELADLVTDLKWADWHETHILAVVLDGNSDVISARVVEKEEDIELLYRLEGVRADHWSISDLFADLLIGIAHGFSMARPTGSHRYVLAILAAIQRHVVEQEE